MRSIIVERRTIPSPAAGLGVLPGSSASGAVNFHVTGYAAVFNVRSERLASPVGRDFVEVIAPGAFRESLRRHDVRALWNHDSNFPLGRVQAGTLVLREDDRGLAFAMELPQTAMGCGFLEAVRRQDVTGMSFGFTVPDGGDRWTKEAAGLQVRTLLQVDLVEVSPVTFPAYPQPFVTSPRGKAESPEQRELRLRKAELEVALDGIDRSMAPAGMGSADEDHRRRVLYLAGL